MPWSKSPARRTLGILAVVVVVLVVLRLTRNAPPPEVVPVESRPAAVPPIPVPPPSTPLPMQFVDVAPEVGLSFAYAYGVTEPTLMLQTTAGGGGWLDYDGDGRLDVYCVNGAPVTPDAHPASLRNALFRQNPDGSFTDVTAAAGVGDTGFGMGCAFGDYDRDGNTDIYVTNFGRNVLYRNNGDGTFADVTPAAGVAGKADAWSTSVLWVDVDADGWLDLYVVNYVQYAVDHGIPCTQEGVATVCAPQIFQAQADVFWHNNGDGTFTDETAARGMASAAGKGLGVIAGDYDDDGDVDLYVANDTTQNLMLRNTGGGYFEEVGLFSGVAFNEDGAAESGMGVSFGDVDGDGDQDLFVTNFQNETNTLYVNQGRSFFMDGTFRAGLGTSSLLYLAFGTGLVDMDNDGDLDLFAANGHIAPKIELIDETATYAQTNQLWLNDGVGNFTDRSTALGPAFANRRVSRAAAFADYDSDGDVDVLVINNMGPAALYRNEGGHAAGHWFGLDLRWADTGTPALGARVQVTVGKTTLVREVRVGGSYLAQNDPRILVGLGEAEDPDGVVITWGAGGRLQLESVDMGGYTRVELPRAAQPEPGR